MKFRFRLEKALHLIRLRETIKKMEVSAIQKRVDFMTRRCETLRSDIHQILERMPLELAFAPYATTQVAATSEEISAMGKLIAEETLALQRKKRELSRLLMRKKAVEALRDKRYREFRIEQNRREQKQMDEVASRLRGERF